MERSEDRILVTHVGSLPRPPDLLELLLARENGEPHDARALEELTARHVSEVVRRQVELGIDVVCDGELGKTSFLTYVNTRLGGLEPRESTSALPWASSREARAFPQYYERAAKANPGAAGALHLAATGPVTYVGTEALRADIRRLKAAVAEHGATEAFMPSISPTNVESWQANEYYDSDEEFLFAIAEAMREEYRAIVESGLLLQVDDPGLVTQYTLRPDWSLEDVRAWGGVRVEALNHALRGLPPERIRFHTCYSINQGPRKYELGLEDIVDLVLRVNAGAYSFEAANPRHEHEWRVWKEVDLPERTVLIPGFVTNSSVVIEHPDTVADRIVRYAGIVGRERVLAGADCGFASFAANDEFMPEIVWAKLEALAEGARRASERLWS
ncbi:MAG TPA: cobalamin-independent methionine synthase II family protein [Streptosporangiaceae bacterium]